MNRTGSDWGLTRSLGRSAPPAGALALALVLALVAAGCAAPRGTLPRDLLAQLRPGVTTMEQARAALGAPDETTALSDGGAEWVYQFAPEPVPPTPDLPVPTDTHRRTDVLLLVFGPTGVLVRHEATRSAFGVRDAAHPPAPDHDALKEIPIK